MGPAKRMKCIIHFSFLLAFLVIFSAMISNSLVFATKFDVLDDSILHEIRWTSTKVNLEQEFTTITTARNEIFRCNYTPKKRLSKEEEYKGPDPYYLIHSLFTDLRCTLKMESYWTYQLCHGRFIRQFHEEKNGESQEYNLGKMSQDEHFFNKPDEWPRQKGDWPRKKIDGVSVPYLQVNMTKGTFCELSKKNRSTRVLYICHPEGKNGIYSIEEVATCEYEVVVLTPDLCSHPDFSPHEIADTIIQCNAVQAKSYPKAIDELESENLKIRHHHLLLDLESLVEGKMKTSNSFVRLSDGSSDMLAHKAETWPGPEPDGFKQLRLFFAGKLCLIQNLEWWQLEFCFGRHVIQFRQEFKNGPKTEIVLGKWNEEKHKAQVTTLKAMKGFPDRAITGSITHYYFDGHLCGNVPRVIVVEYKCANSLSTSKGYTLQLLEPDSCRYKLILESPFLCPLVQKADEYNLFDVDSMIISEQGNKHYSTKEHKKFEPETDDTVSHPQSKSTTSKSKPTSTPIATYYDAELVILGQD